MYIADMPPGNTVAIVPPFTQTVSGWAAKPGLTFVHPPVGAVNLTVSLNPDDAWFWTEEWQLGEAEANADIANGRIDRFLTDEDFLAALDD